VETEQVLEYDKTSMPQSLGHAAKIFVDGHALAGGSPKMLTSFLQVPFLSFPKNKTEIN
jgi:hypothetical protein